MTSITEQGRQLDTSSRFPDGQPYIYVYAIDVRTGWMCAGAFDNKGATHIRSLNDKVALWGESIALCGKHGLDPKGPDAMVALGESLAMFHQTPLPKVAAKRNKTLGHPESAGHWFNLVYRLEGTGDFLTRPQWMDLHATGNEPMSFELAMDVARVIVRRDSTETGTRVSKALAAGGGPFIAPSLQS